MVAQPLSEPRRPAPVTSLAAARHLRTQRQRLLGLTRALLTKREAEVQPLKDEIAELQARAEWEMPARRAYWNQLPPLSSRGEHRGRFA
ncbi:MAG: hypothetical protein ACRDJ9_20690 [Dehalococcoidia bacterium]